MVTRTTSNLIAVLSQSDVAWVWQADRWGINVRRVCGKGWPKRTLVQYLFWWQPGCIFYSSLGFSVHAMPRVAKLQLEFPIRMNSEFFETCSKLSWDLKLQFFEETGSRITLHQVKARSYQNCCRVLFGDRPLAPCLTQCADLPNAQKKAKVGKWL